MSYYRHFFDGTGCQSEMAAAQHALEKGNSETAYSVITPEMQDQVAVVGSAEHCRTELENRRSLGPQLLDPAAIPCASRPAVQRVGILIPSQTRLYTAWRSRGAIWMLHVAAGAALLPVGIAIIGVTRIVSLMSVVMAPAVAVVFVILAALDLHPWAYAIYAIVAAVLVLLLQFCLIEDDHRSDAEAVNGDQVTFDQVAAGCRVWCDNDNGLIEVGCNRLFALPGIGTNEYSVSGQDPGHHG